MSPYVHAGWDLLQAASRGDRNAFVEMCEQLREPMMHAVQRQLELESQEATDARVADVTARVCEIAFRELAEKPHDWSTYGWLRWLVTRELSRDVEPERRSAPERSDRVQTGPRRRRTPMLAG